MTERINYHENVQGINALNLERAKKGIGNLSNVAPGFEGTAGLRHKEV